MIKNNTIELYGSAGNGILSGGNSEIIDNNISFILKIAILIALEVNQGRTYLLLILKAIILLFDKYDY